MADAARTLHVETEWLTLAEAALYTRMSRRALESHIASGRLRPDSRARPGFKLHRFRRSTLDAFLTGESDGQK